KGIMAAKAKPVDTVTAADLGIESVSWAQQITSVDDAPAREAGEVIEDDGETFNKIVEFLDGLKVI
ncbi:MAG: electron transfer flavoprotein beta subunit, partial [Candidatus Azotimanducaceae bacterium]